jgi:hypothetical protein
MWIKEKGASIIFNRLCPPDGTNLVMLFFLLNCRDRSGVSHCITWRSPLSCKRVDISGAVAFGVSGLSSLVLWISSICITILHTNQIFSPLGYTLLSDHRLEICSPVVGIICWLHQKVQCSMSANGRRMFICHFCLLLSFFWYRQMRTQSLVLGQLIHTDRSFLLLSATDV